MVGLVALVPYQEAYNAGLETSDAMKLLEVFADFDHGRTDCWFRFDRAYDPRMIKELTGGPATFWIFIQALLQEVFEDVSLTDIDV